jgi:MerR family copper efflux transcriptional regulator
MDPGDPIRPSETGRDAHAAARASAPTRLADTAGPSESARITKTAQRLGISPRMLRYRESLGLLPAVRAPRRSRPAAPGARRHRRFTPADLDAVALGLSIERRYDITPAALAFGLRVLADQRVRAEVAELGARIGRIQPPPARALDFEQERALRLLRIGATGRHGRRS